jgi:hypothetical protein
LFSWTSGWFKEKTGGLIVDLKENIKESFVARGGDAEYFLGKSRTDSGSVSNSETGSLRGACGKPKPLNQMIFYGKVIKNQNLDTPKAVKANFSQGVEIVTHGWQFGYEEIKKKILGKKLVSVYLDTENEKQENYLHAVVFVVPNYGVSFNMNFGVGKNQKFLDLLTDILKDESILKIIFDYKDTLRVLKQNLDLPGLSGINNYHDVHNYISKPGQNQYFSFSTGSDVTSIRPMALRYLNIGLASNLPNWCNEEKCSGFEALSTIFARGLVMLEIYKFFVKNDRFLDTARCVKKKLADLNKKQRYLIDIYLGDTYGELEKNGVVVFGPESYRYKDLSAQAKKDRACILTNDVYFANLYYQEEPGEVYPNVILVVK